MSKRSLSTSAGSIPTLSNRTLETIACHLLKGRLVDVDLVARSERRPDVGAEILTGIAIGPRCPTATVTVVVGSRPKRFREVEMNAATGAVLAVHNAGRSFA